MKKYFYLTISFLSSTLLFHSCVEDLPTYFEYSGYEFANLDANAGKWKLILHTSNEEVAIPNPAAVGSIELNRELSDAKEKISRATSDQKESVKYWTNNPVLRWNEIALELAAKYNLIPGPNPDGTYTYTPDANFNGTDVFTYQICDVDGDCESATVTITITPADDMPQDN